MKGHHSSHEMRINNPQNQNHTHSISCSCYIEVFEIAHGIFT